MDYGELFAKWRKEGILQGDTSLGKSGPPDEPRDERGRWTSNGTTETHISDYEPLAHVRHTLSDPKDSTFIKKQQFVDKYLTATEKTSQELNVPVTNMLALAAVESGWGKASRFTTEGNNFFGQHYPAPFMQGEPMKAHDNGDLMARFPSYEDSLKSFATQYGYIVKGISDPVTFAQALQNSEKFGINPSDGTKVKSYISDVAGTIHNLAPFIDRTRQSRK